MHVRRRRCTDPLTDHLRGWKRTETNDHLDIALRSVGTQKRVAVSNDATMRNPATASWISKDRPTQSFGEHKHGANVVDATTGDDKAAFGQCAGFSKWVAKVDNGVFGIVEWRLVRRNANERFVEREVAMHRTWIGSGSCPPCALGKRTP